MIIVSIDPGMSTGIAVLDARDAESRPRLVDYLQIENGLASALRALESLGETYGEPGDAVEIVCEKFSPRPGARSWRLNELEPIRIEGALSAMYGDDVTYRRPEARKLINDDLRATEEFLRWAGYWRVPSDVGLADADDVNAAIMHAIGYLRDKAHMPTIGMLIEYGDTITEATL